MQFVEKEMKIGNVSQSVLKRSVLKPLQTKREEVFIQPTVEEICSGIRIDETNGVVTSSTVVYGNEKELGIYAIAEVLNNIVARNGDPVGVDIIIQLPTFAYESRLKTMVEIIEQCCKEQNIQVTGIKVTVNPVLNVAMVYATAMGVTKVEKYIQCNDVRANQDIVLINSIGITGALRILEMRKDIKEKFIPSFFNSLENKKTHILAADIIQKIRSEFPVNGVRPIGAEGLYGAIWNMAEVKNMGVEINIKQVPIMQEVIEITECVSINPYQLNSIGSILIMIEDGEKLVEYLTKQGYVAATIGKTKNTTERVIYNGEEKRFLDKPAMDEMLKLYEI